MILVIDDDTDFRGFLAASLMDEGYEVVTAVHGADGLAKYAELGDAVKLIVLDLRMPVMDGRSFLEHYTGSSPVIVCSAWPIPEGLHADGYLNKPFEVMAFFEMAARLMEVGRGVL